MKLYRIDNPPVAYLAESEDDVGTLGRLAHMGFHPDENGLTLFRFVFDFYNGTPHTVVYNYFYMILCPTHIVKMTHTVKIPSGDNCEMTYDLHMDGDITNNEYTDLEGREWLKHTGRLSRLARLFRSR